MELEYIRSSQLGTYLECSAKFLFANILKIETPSKPALAFGSAIHKTLEQNFSQKIKTRQDLPVEYSVALFSDTLDELIKDVEKADLTNYDSERSLKDAGVELVKKYFKEFAYRIFPKLVETTIQVKLAGYPYGLSGTVDLLDEDNVLIDHKTSAKIPKEITQNYRLQLGGAYAVLMEAKLDEKVRYARLDYLVRKGLTSTRIIPIEVQTDTEYFLVLFEAISKGIEQGVFYANRTHYLCSKKYCKYWQACEKKFGGVVRQ